MRGTVDEPLEQLGRVFTPGPFLDRRLGRGLAFQALYEMDLGHHVPAEVLERMAVSFESTVDGPYPAEVLRQATGYAQELVRGVLEHRSGIDGLIQERAPLWPLVQMSAVDRNVLRIGLYESLYGNAKVPLRTAINEAVELAKVFGSETSAKFVNGVLGRAVEVSASGRLPGPASPEPAQFIEPGGAETHALGADDPTNHPATPPDDEKGV